MDRAALQAFLGEVFPQVADDFTVEEVRPMGLRLRLHVTDKDLRPGGTVSGPAMFALADVAVYLAVLAMIGPEALAVTTRGGRCAGLLGGGGGTCRARLAHLFDPAAPDLKERPARGPAAVRMIRRRLASRTPDRLFGFLADI